MKYVLLSLLGLAIIIGLCFGLGYLGVGYTKTVGKAQQNADRQVFESTQSRVDAMREECSKYELEYEEDTSFINRNAIRRMLLQDFASFDKTQLSVDQQQFLRSLQ